MTKQRYMITYNNTEVFFMDYSFKSAYEHAQDFIARNKDKYDMQLFYRNTSYFGPPWLLYETVNANKTTKSGEKPNHEQS